MASNRILWAHVTSIVVYIIYAVNNSLKLIRPASSWPYNLLSCLDMTLGIDISYSWVRP